MLMKVTDSNLVLVFDPRGITLGDPQGDLRPDQKCAQGRR
jgi:hypothetical protein